VIDDLLPCVILVPSLGRSQRLREVAQNIHEATPEAHEILFCVGDPESKAVLDEIGERYLDDEGETDKRYVTRMNRLIRVVRYEGRGQTVFFGSDDVRHHRGWLSEALRVMDGGPRVVVVNDLRNRNGTQAVMHIDYTIEAVFDAPGDVFHHGYQHNFADDEQFFTAFHRGQFARAMGSFVEHLHPVFGAPGSMAWDSTYTNAQIHWDDDAERFHSRVVSIDGAYA
jgi:hypothetical protein